MLPLPLKAIVVDDEKLSREGLINYISEFCPDINVVDQCNTANRAYHSILKHNPHIVFLDIEMPKGSGIDLLKRFKTISFKVIFVTAYPKYAVKAFRYAATDFLLKPVKVSELQEAVNRAKKELENENFDVNIEHLLHSINSISHQIEGRLSIPDHQGFKVLDTDKIILCQADTSYTIFFLEDQKNVMAPYHLKHYGEQLPESHFLRVHRSYIVNLQHVIGMQNNVIQLSKKLSCPLGASYKEAFKSRFNKSKK